MRLRAARAPPPPPRANPVPAPRPLPFRGVRPPRKNAPGSRVEPPLGPCHRGNALARVDQLLLRGVAAEAEADRRAALRIAEAERAKHMAWPARAAGAG